MLWVALSAFIMTVTGKGDDALNVRRFFLRLREAVQAEVHDPARRRKATDTLDGAAAAFMGHRKRLSQISGCLARVDRSYGAAPVDYQRCISAAAPEWDRAAREIVDFDVAFRRALTPAEYAAVRHRAEP